MAKQNMNQGPKPKAIDAFVKVRPMSYDSTLDYTPNDPDGDWCILSFGRGHEVICPLPDMRTTWVSIPRAATVRNWGTQLGLGQLAAMGFCERTVFDAIPHGLEIPHGAIHALWRMPPAASRVAQAKVDEMDLELLKSTKTV